MNNQPLKGKRIMVTRSVGQSAEFSDRLQKAGAKVIEMPTLEITPPSSWEKLDNAISKIAALDWLILTSSNGVDYFFERFFIQGKKLSDLTKINIAVVGKKTAESLIAKGREPDFIPPDFVADSLVANFPADLKSKKILFPRVETGGREVLVKELTEKGAEVWEIPAYDSRCPETIDPIASDALKQGKIDIITFASSKTVKNFYQLLTQIDENYNQNLLENICIASIGPQTSKTCQELFSRVDVEAKEYTMEGLYQSLVQYNLKEVSD